MVKFALSVSPDYLDKLFYKILRRNSVLSWTPHLAWTFFFIPFFIDSDGPSSVASTIGTVDAEFCNPSFFML